MVSLLFLFVQVFPDCESLLGNIRWSLDPATFYHRTFISSFLSRRAVIRPRGVRRRQPLAAAARRFDSDQSDDCVAGANARTTPRRPTVARIRIRIILIIVVVIVVCGRNDFCGARTPRGRARVQTRHVRTGMAV